MKRIFALCLLCAVLFGILCACTPATPPDGPGEGTTTTGNGGTTGTTDPDNPPTPGTKQISLNGNFTVVGSAASRLTAALAAAGIDTLGTDKTYTVYAISDGDTATEAGSAGAALLAAREENYGDFAVFFEGTSLTVYARNEKTFTDAISYLSQFFKEGALIVPEKLSHVQQKTLPNILLGDKPITDYTVVAREKSLAGVAENFARDLGAVCGKVPKISDSQARRAINLVVEDAKSEAGFSEVYEVKVTGNALTLTAKTKASLSYALSDFIASLNGDKTFTAEDNGTRTFRMIHKDATDTGLFKYCGMWQATDKTASTTMVSYWNAAYVEITFTGNAITPEFSRETTFKIKMDDAADYSGNYKVNGKITFFAEGSGTHTLRIYAKNRDAHMYFAGVSAEENVILSRTPNKKHYIQFVGDSISDAGNSFSHRVGDVLGWDFSVTALSGIALETNKGYWKNNNPKTFGDMGVNIGMEDAFFRLGIPQDSMSEEERAYYVKNYYDSEELCYNFESGNKPDIVFIFLGTNDELGQTSDATRFANAYVDFVRNILDVYGKDTQICVLQALSNSSAQPNEESPRYKCVRAAVSKLEELFAENIFFIDRDEILTWNVEIGSDYTHPTSNGYDTLTEKIAALLKESY